MRENIIEGLFLAVLMGAIIISVVPLLSAPLNAVRPYQYSSEVSLLVMVSIVVIVIGAIRIHR